MPTGSRVSGSRLHTPAGTNGTINTDRFLDPTNGFSWLSFVVTPNSGRINQDTVNRLVAEISVLRGVEHVRAINPYDEPTTLVITVHLAERNPKQQEAGRVAKLIRRLIAKALN